MQSVFCAILPIDKIKKMWYNAAARPRTCLRRTSVRYTSCTNFCPHFCAICILTISRNCGILSIEDKERVLIMDKVTLIIGKTYEEQNADTKAKISKHDFKEIENLIIFKKRFKKSIDK